MPIKVFRICVTSLLRRCLVADSVYFLDGPLRHVLAWVELFGSRWSALAFTHQIALTEDALHEVPGCAIRFKTLSVPKFVRSNFAQPEIHGVCVVGILEIQSGL